MFNNQYIKIIIVLLLVLIVLYILKQQLLPNKKEGYTPLDVDPNYKFSNAQNNTIVNDAKEFLGNNTMTSNNGQIYDIHNKVHMPTNENLWDSYFKNISTNGNIPTVPNVNSKPKETDIDLFTKQFHENNKEGVSFDVNNYIPKEINNEWFQQDLSNYPQVNQEKLIDISKECNGINTIGNSLKNASWDIRGNIPNPKIIVGPFLNSSYDPDTNLRTLCNSDK